MMIRSALTIYSLLLLLSGAEGGVIKMEQHVLSDCPQDCTCEQPNLFVNCSRLDGPVPSIPAWATSIITTDDNLMKVPPLIYTQHRDYITLDLSDNQLTEKVLTPDVFGSVRSIQFLSLAYNPITEVPRTLPRNITWLIFVGCQLTYVGKDSFDYFVFMSDLDLSFNPITAVHPEALIPLKSLTEFSLEFNKINATGLPRGVFSKVRNLTTLGLRFNVLGAVPMDLPNSILNLDLVGTKLTSIAKGAFRDIPKLQTLALWQNPLQEIEDFAFEGLTQVTYLDMTECKVPYLTKNTFNGFTSLQKLFIFGNAISRIEPGAFADCEKSMEQYWLMSNRMTTLDVSFNSTFRQKQVNFLSVYDNPWVCDCHLRWLKELQEELADQLQMAPHLIICAAPPQLEGKAWDTIHAQDFTCGNGAPE